MSDTEEIQDIPLLEEGTYGCAFKKALPCKKSKAGTKVGKIIRKQHAGIELTMASIIEGIDGWARFYIIQEEDECTSNNFKALHETYNAKCKVLKNSKNSNLTQLISTYGGITLHRTPITRDFEFMRNFRHMLEGISKLEQQGVCHYDLKDNNIVVDSRGTLRIIDFGSAFLGDKVTEKNIWLHQYNFIPEYIPQAPELSVQNGLHDGFSRNYSIQETIKRKSVFKTMESVLGISSFECERELRSFWEDEDELWVPFFLKYWRTWDSWSIGVIFLNILKIMVFQGVQIDNFVLIKNVLKGMLACDARKRLTPTQAYELVRYY